MTKEPKPWLVRIPEVFDGVAEEVLASMGGILRRKLGQEYYSIDLADPGAAQRSEVAKFVLWNIPIEHMWPCDPRKMELFIEKAAQTLVKKFGGRKPQGIFIGQLNPGSPDRYYRRVASNLRGRALQLFGGMSVREVEAQDPEKDTLFCLVGKEGLFCGIQSPRAANGLYPGGSKFIDQSSPGTVSRAGAKIAEALHYLLMYRGPMPPGSHWVELGACPGGMTAELLKRDQRVTAIDRAPLDKRLQNNAGVEFILAEVATFVPPEGTVYDAVLSDLNGPPAESIGHVIRLLGSLREGGLVVFTLKVPRVENVDSTCRIYRAIAATAEQAGLRLVAQTHLTYNRHEFTLFFEKAHPNSSSK